MKWSGWLSLVVVLLGCVRLSDGQPQAKAWTAHWIQAPWSTERDGAELDGSRPMPVFRRQFGLQANVAHAELRIAGLGQFVATINGDDIGPKGLHEAWTNYRRSIAYEHYDLTRSLRPGTNTLSVALGNGMYNVQRTKGRYTKFEGSFGTPKLTAELRVTYADGRIETIASDATWQAAHGPVVFSSTYGGEDYDARRQPDDWVAAQVVDSPGGALIPAIAPEVTESTSHAIVKQTVLAPGKIVYDLGQNFAGVPSIRVRGPAGATLRLIPGELLGTNGAVSQHSSGGPMWWSYTLRGTPGGESWQPQFGYYGFRYLQAEWSSPDATIDSLTGREWHSASPVTGSFTSSSEMLNRIHALIVASMHNNEASLFTDCPHREKLGWLEETHLVAPGMLFNNDLARLFAATDHNIADAQLEDGDVPTIAPQYTKFGPRYPIYDDSPEWGSAAILAPWAAYRYYGDATELERSYPVMQRYLTFLESKAVDGIVAYGLGDWYDIGPGGPGVEKNTTLGVTATLMLYEDAATMQRIATILHRPADAARYQALATRERTAFNTRFWNDSAGWYDTGSQTANAMPLALGIVPEAKRAAVLAHIVADIHAHNDHVTTGEVGYPYMMRALTEAGRSDVLLAMMLRTDAPSYGSQLAAGATALTEAWDANPASSQDHFMLGGAEEWFYRGLGGIDLDMSRPTTERIAIHPRIVAGLDWVRCGYASKLGRIESNWRREGDHVTFEVTIPDRTVATIILPAESAGTPEIRRSVGPGIHRFTIKSER